MHLKSTSVTLAFLAMLLPSAVVAAPANDVDVKRDICLTICYFNKPNCPKPSYPVKVNNCWTCCTPQGGPIETRDGAEDGSEWSRRAADDDSTEWGK